MSESEPGAEPTAAIFRAVVSRTCEHDSCEESSEYVFVVTGEFGDDGLAAYCQTHADGLDDSDVHTAVGEVEHV